MAQYANGFSIIASKEAGEFIVTFTQNQPDFNPESGAIDKLVLKEVVTLILPFSLGKELAEHIEEVAEKEEKK